MNQNVIGSRHDQQDLPPPRHQQAAFQKMNCIPILLEVLALVLVRLHRQQQGLPPPLHPTAACQTVKCIPTHYPEKLKLHMGSKIRLENSLYARE